MPNKVEVGESAQEVAEQQKQEKMKQDSSTVENNSNEEKETNGEKKTENEASPSKNDAFAMLAQGKRHLFVKDYPSAVAILGNACAKLSEVYGEMADECGDAYFSYGRALLELSREESNVLVENEGGEGSDETEEEEEKDENEEEAIDEHEEEANEENKKEDEENKDNKSSEDKAAVEDGKTAEENGKNIEKNGTTTEEDEKTTDENEDEKEEDVNNLQLAWEVFELAKVIYHRQNNDAKLAETYLYLGEVSLESENYTNAVEDMKKCLNLQKKILPEDHRDIAETLFQLGVACSFENMFDESKAYYKSASEVLEKRIKNLESGVQPEVPNTDNPFYSVEKEIEEIKAILPEIKEKLDDVEDLKKETLKSMMDLMKGGSSSSADGAGPSSAKNGNAEKPVTNISHLIKKKRKPEEELTPEKVKKSCSEEKSQSS